MGLKLAVGGRDLAPLDRLIIKYIWFIKLIPGGAGFLPSTAVLNNCPSSKS